MRPLAVLGSGFHAGETVRVSVRTDEGADEKRSGRPAGRIDVRFPKLKLRRCPTYIISARGDEGSRADAAQRAPPLRDRSLETPMGRPQAAPR